MVSVQVQRCKIFNEFDREQQHQYFGISLNKSLHHIDTLYYAVYINEPDDIMELQDNGKLPENLQNFLLMLKEAKNELKANPGETVDFDNLEAVPRSFSMYEYCVSLNECFDIFISNYIPTKETPRIVVQLRSRYLVMEGVVDALEESFTYLKEFLKPFGLFPVKVRENRIDYAFHTNLIQNPYKFFSDDNLKKHLKTKLVKGAKDFTFGEEIKLETLQLGNRKSNNVFFRAYDKTKEVIDMNYKSFFITRWFQNGLISEFDKFVYEIAYELKAYRTGVLVGRLKWYIQHGSDEELISECKKLLETNYIKSDNCEQIEKKLHNIIPEPTLIFNIEFQTKRKFFVSCSKWLDMLCELPYGNKTVVPVQKDPLLKPIFEILENSRFIIDYLTSYGNVVSFVKDRHLSMKQFLDQEQPYQNWWKRIRSTPVDYSMDSIIDLYRTYDTEASIRKSQRTLQGQIARLAILNRSDTDESTFEEDFADALCFLNDNDVPPFVKNPEFGKRSIEPFDYREIQLKKARQMRGIIKKGAIKEKDNLK